MIYRYTLQVCIQFGRSDFVFWNQRTQLYATIRLLDRILTRQIHLTCTQMAESWWITDSSSTSWWIFFTGWVWRWILMPFSHLSRIDYTYTIFINKMRIAGSLSGDVRSWLLFAERRTETKKEPSIDEKEDKVYWEEE